MTEKHIPGRQPEQHKSKRRETTTSPVSSELAGMFLEEQVRKGRTIEIPSLGIVLTKDKLRSPSQKE